MIRAVSLLAAAILTMAAAPAQSSPTVNLDSQTIRDDGNVQVQVDVGVPTGETATLEFELWDGSTQVGKSVAAQNEGGNNQQFGVIFQPMNPGDPPPTPAEGMTVVAKVVASGGGTAEASGKL